MNLAKSIFVTLFCLISFSIFAQYEFISPIPNSQYHNVETSIIFRDGAYIDESSLNDNIFSLYSNETGYHSANIILSTDSKTIIINPDVDFNSNDKIYVSLTNILRTDGTEVDSITFEFYTTINTSKILPNNEETIFLTKNLYKAKTIPETFPSISTLVYDNPYEGYIFFQNSSSSANNNDRYISIINHNNEPYFYIQDNSRGLAFTKQKTDHYSFFNPFSYNFYLLDTTFAIIDSFACDNGYNADFHEFQFHSNGHAYLLAYDNQTIDMSEIVDGGDVNAQVTGSVIQELDSDKNIIFQWRTWDYYEIIDVSHFVDLTSHYFSYAHTNSLDIDEDENILISNYLMDEITHINGKTGEIIWRFGGKNNEFSFLNDTIGFTTQHDARRLPNGNITLYDNGLFHTNIVSSAKEYELDEINKTAQLVWSYTHPLNFSCPRSGNVQRLPNGNTFINWGWIPNTNCPSMTEVRPDSTIVHEISFDNSSHLIYRGYKFLILDNDSTNKIEDKNIRYSKTYAYPNPAQNIVNIFHNIKSTKHRLKIQDINGKDVTSIMTIKNINNTSLYKLDCSSLSSGIYLYVITSEYEKQIGKFVIVR